MNAHSYTQHAASLIRARQTTSDAHMHPEMERRLQDLDLGDEPLELTEAMTTVAGAPLFFAPASERIASSPAMQDRENEMQAMAARLAMDAQNALHPQQDYQPASPQITLEQEEQARVELLAQLALNAQQAYEDKSYGHTSPPVSQSMMEQHSMQEAEQHHNTVEPAYAPPKSIAPIAKSPLDKALQLWSLLSEANDNAEAEWTVQFRSVRGQPMRYTVSGHSLTRGPVTRDCQDHSTAMAVMEELLEDDVSHRLGGLLLDTITGNAAISLESLGFQTSLNRQVVESALGPMVFKCANGEQPAALSLLGYQVSVDESALSRALGSLMMASISGKRLQLAVAMGLEDDYSQQAVLNAIGSRMIDVLAGKPRPELAVMGLKVEVKREEVTQRLGMLMYRALDGAPHPILDALGFTYPSLEDGSHQ